MKGAKPNNTEKAFTMPMGCMCFNQNCHKSMDGSGCFRCKKAGGTTGLIPDLNGLSGASICGCPLCICTCSTQCESRHVQQIATQTALTKRAETCRGSASVGDGLFGNFLQGIVNEGIANASSPNPIGAQGADLNGQLLKQPRADVSQQSVRVSRQIWFHLSTGIVFLSSQALTSVQKLAYT